MRTRPGIAGAYIHTYNISVFSSPPSPRSNRDHACWRLILEPLDVIMSGLATLRGRMPFSSIFTKSPGIPAVGTEPFSRWTALSRSRLDFPLNPLCRFLFSCNVDAAPEGGDLFPLSHFASRRIPLGMRAMQRFPTAYDGWAMGHGVLCAIVQEEEEEGGGLLAVGC